MDPEEYRVESRERWERAAGGWEQARPAMQRDTEVVSRWLIDAVDPQPGQTVLELAAGPGDTGLLAAERVGPEGRVIITDGAQAMVDVAERRAAELGIANADMRVMEAEWIDLSTASVDGVVCRWGYMLLADPETALRETRRVLRPAGRVALAAWDERRLNPWLGTIQRVLDERGLATPTDPGDPGPFAFAFIGLIEDLLDAAGFTDPQVEAVDFSFHAASLDAWWDQLVTTSPSLGGVLADLSPKDHYELRDAFDAAYAPFTAGDGSVEMPARTLVAAATA